ncbi:MAG: hypothetical protein ACR2RB_10100, partial [Gammaproteobacteria bacterium]
YYVAEEAVGNALAAGTMFNIIHISSVVKIDIMVRKTGEYRIEEFKRRRQVTLQGIPIWIVTKEDLILSKLEWASDSKSELQLRDVRNLLATNPDWDYLHRWAEYIGVSALLKEVVE